MRSIGTRSLTIVRVYQVARLYLFRTAADVPKFLQHVAEVVPFPVQCAVLEEFLVETLRPTFYETVDALQTDLDV